MDLSELTNDQLLQLLTATLAESANRSFAIATAAQNTATESIDRLRERIATAQQIDIDPQAAEKSAIVHATIDNPHFQPFLPSEFTIKISHPKQETRILLVDTHQRWKLTYYHTGNFHNRPGTIVTAPTIHHHPQLSNLFAKLATEFSNTQIECNSADRIETVNSALYTRLCQI